MTEAMKNRISPNDPGKGFNVHQHLRPAEDHKAEPCAAYRLKQCARA